MWQTQHCKDMEGKVKGQRRWTQVRDSHHFMKWGIKMETPFLRKENKEIEVVYIYASEMTKVTNGC